MATPGRAQARKAAVAALLALYYVMALSAASQKSMTFDEMAHLTGGYTYWAFNDYRLHPENGNWPQRLGRSRPSWAAPRSRRSISRRGPARTFTSSATSSCTSAAAMPTRSSAAAAR